MANETAEATGTAQLVSPTYLAEAVRHNLHLAETASVELTEVAEFSNMNYVFRATTPERSLYLKVVPARPRNFPIDVPPERVFSEAEGLRRFRNFAEGVVLIPEVLFVDGQEMVLGMSDVGVGRDVLFRVIAEQYDLLVEQAENLGKGLGAIHGGTRGVGSVRPPKEEFIIRKIVFDGLLRPGAMAVFPELWPEISAEMQACHECLVHGDLWSKNLLVRRGEPIAIVDFEGVSYGDPAFDLATLTAVALLPAMEHDDILPAALEFVERFLSTWSLACASAEWGAAVNRRVFRATAVFLAARGFGPFAYAMSDTARQRVSDLAGSLAKEVPEDFDGFASRIRYFLGSQSSRPN